MTGVHYQSRPAPSRRIVVTVAVVLLAVFVVGGYFISVFLSDEWRRSQIDLVETFTKARPDPDWPYLDATDRTSQVCGSEVNCAQSVGNEYLTLLKFHSVDAARKYAGTLGPDAVQVDPFVIRFDGVPLSAETRTEIVYTLSNINVGSPD